MARARVKKRTQAKASSKKTVVNGAASRNMDRAPKSMVIRVGDEDVGRSVRQLVRDVRQVMQPDTAARLKERKKNRLRDYTTMAGPLGVTHFILFSRSEKGTLNMRLAITPRGPTLNFRVENYSLCKDIIKAMRRHPSFDGMHLTAPLLIMNNFLSKQTDADPAKSDSSAVPKHLESLVTTVFQSLFPPVSPQTMPLSSVKRVLLLNREPPSNPGSSAYTITLRHYAIKTKSVGLPRAIKRINAAEKVHSTDRKGKGVPNLSQLEDVADYILDGDAGNYTSASESEAETDAEVDVLALKTRKLHYKQKLEKKKKAEDENGKASGAGGGIEKRAIKLTELGPRMKLRLVKVEEGLCDGKVMWHEFIEKNKDEQRELDEKWEVKNKEKETRKKQQRANLEKKKKERAEKGGDDEDEDMEDYDDWDGENWVDDDDDAMDEDDEDDD